MGPMPSPSSATGAATLVSMSREERRRFRQQLNEALTVPFASELPPNWGSPAPQVRVDPKRGTVTIEWVQGPASNDVAGAVTELVVGAGLALVLSQRYPWSCGYFHDDRRDAYLFHHGHDLTEVTYCGGCGHCDGHETLSPGDAYDERVGAGERLDPPCRPGRWVACPVHQIDGTSAILGTRGRPAAKGPDRVCGLCGESLMEPLARFRAYVDLDDPKVAAAYPAAYERLCELAWDRYRAENPPVPEVPTVSAWVAEQVTANSAAEVEGALRRLLGRDRKVLERWLADRSTR